MDAAQLEIRPPKVPFLGGSSVSYVDKEIEFVPARKRFNGLASSNGDFKIETLNASRPPEPSGKIVSANLSLMSGAAKKADAPDSIESWMDQELSFRVSFQRIANDVIAVMSQGAGLQNLGNTCFLNSVLQCLTYTEPLAAYLQTGKHQSSCRINGFCALCAIQKHVSRALQATGRSLAPKDLVSNLRCISRSFRNARQEDAHEYMVNLLESMHKCCLPSGVPSESPSAYEKSLVHKIFGGRLRSQVKCLQCDYSSNKYDPFTDLSLEIARADSVLKALGHFTTAEHLDGGAKQYQCQKCKEKVRAMKQLTVHKAPYVLTIHLKRFHALNPGEKINKNVRFDPKLDLKPFVSGTHEGDLKYSLYGVLVHHGGSTRSGHYLCYVRTSTNMWYLLNDNTVLQVSESAVLQQKAYMLFYIRNRDTTPRRRAEIAQKEILKEQHTLNRGSFSFSQSSSCAVQLNQTTDKSGSSVSSCSVVTKGMVSVYKADTIMNGASVNGSTVAGYEKETKKLPTPTLVNNDGDLGKSIPIASNSKVNEHSKDSTAYVAQSLVSNDFKDGNDNMMVDHRITHKNTGDKINTDSMVSDKQSSCKINKVEPLKESQNGADDDEKSTLEESVVLTATTVTHSESSEVEKIDRKGQSKIKKKHSKYQLTIIHFGTNVFLRASLGPRKKHMKKKRRSSKIKKDRANSDLGPSTSESRNLDKVKSHKRKGDHKGQKEAKRSSDQVGRTAENGAVLASEFQVPKNTNSTTESSQTKAKAVETANEGKRDTMQNCFMSVLKREIEETIVAHWDDVNTTPPTIESNTTVTSIGHLLDEWDEEYDRGKRKKIRVSQHEFGGPNLFQQVASGKFKSKKAKFDRARSGNQPYRI